jgi:AAA domain
MGDAYSRDSKRDTYSLSDVPGGGLAKPKIILIGPDCSGKSNLATRLGHHYGCRIIGNRRIKDDLEAAYSVLEFTRRHVASPSSSFVLDQWQYPVDIIYNKELRGGPSVMEAVEKIILAYLKKHNVILLHVDASDSTLRDRFAVRGDELWDIEQILKVAAAYREYMPKSPLIGYRIDTSNLSKFEAAQQAISLIDAHYRRRSE